MYTSLEQQAQDIRDEIIELEDALGTHDCDYDRHCTYCSRENEMLSNKKRALEELEMMIEDRIDGEINEALLESYG